MIIILHANDTGHDVDQCSTRIWQDEVNPHFNLIALLHDDVTIKTLFNARDHGRLAGTKQRKFTEKPFKFTKEVK